MKWSVQTVGLVVLAVVLLAFSCVNVFLNFRPTAEANENVYDDLYESAALAPAERQDVYAELRQQQEFLLVQNPIDPHAWMRLAFLRNATQGNRRYAFEALKFADAIAHPDNDGGLERTLMWHDYADVQTHAERQRETELWRTAYRQHWDNLGTLVRQHHVLDDLKAAVLSDPVLAARWNKK